MKAAVIFIVHILLTDVASGNTSYDIIKENEQTDSRFIANDFITKELSVSNGSRPSSHCWIASITTLNRLSKDDLTNTNPFTSGSSYCAAMTEDQLDVLALELTNCELVKASRVAFNEQSHGDSLVPSSTTSSICPLGRSDHHQLYNAASCLGLLTDHAHSIYHQIRLHTKSLCSHLADEMFQREKEEMTQMLALQIQAVLNGTASAIDQLNFQSILLQNHSQHLKEHQMDLKKMYEARKREEVAQTLVMKEYQLEIEQMYERRKQEEVEAERLRKLREESTSSLLQHQTELIKSQQADFQDMLNAKEALLEEKLRQRMIELKQMQEMIASAHLQIKPLSKIEAYVKIATDGFTIFKTVLNFFVSINVVWICTALSLFNQARRCLYGAVALGFILELFVILCADCELLGSFCDTDVIEIIRHWTRVGGIFILFISCLMPCVRPLSHDTNNYESRVDDFLRNQLEFVSQLNPAQREVVLATTSNNEYDPITTRRENHSLKRSKSRYTKRRSPDKRNKPVVTPYRPSVNKAKLTSTSMSTKEKHCDTIEILKEIQRGSIDTCTKSTNIQWEEPVSSVFMRNRKRKFAETREVSQVMEAQRDDESISCVSSESLSIDSDSKKPKTTEDQIIH